MKGGKRGYIHDVSYMEIFRLDFDKEVTSENAHKPVVRLLTMRENRETDLVAFITTDIFSTFSHTCDGKYH